MMLVKRQKSLTRDVGGAYGFACMPGIPALSKSRSNWTKNDSVSGFLRRSACMACKRN